MNSRSPSLVAAVAALVAGAVGAQTVTVTTAADRIDIKTTGTILDLPGPDGKVSFSEAMIATNNTPGHQTVGFAIPQVEWKLQGIYPGRAVIMSSVGYYFRAWDTVTIDATTQTKFTGDTNPNGGEVVFHGNAVYLLADSCKVTGLDSTTISIVGSRCTAVANTGTSDIDVYQGGNNRVENNVCRRIRIDRADDNVVAGNTVEYVLVWGGGVAAPALRNRIGGPTPAERNLITGFGTWNSEGLPSGITLHLAYTQDTRVENNRIGTTPDGMAQGHDAATIGIGFEGYNKGVTVKDNQIAGILGRGGPPHNAGRVFGWAVYFAGPGSDITLVGNAIGLDATGAPTLGSVWGIDVGHAGKGRYTAVRIGGAQRGEANEIAGHRFNGVTVGAGSDDVRLQGNSIHDNGSLGIDLVPPSGQLGPTPNDTLDTDTGGNGLQNHPILGDAFVAGAGLRVKGALRSSASAAFTLEFFASPACNPTGSTQGTRSLGTIRVTTSATGDAAFDALLPTSAPAGWAMTATATAEPGGATSEFSQCIPIGDGKAALRLYGTACAGSAGTPNVTNNSLPVLGNPAFELGLQGARPQSLALLYFATRQSAQPIQGCTLLIEPLTIVYGAQMQTSTSGTAAARFAIPNDASLIMARVFAQWFNQDGRSANLALIGGGAATNGAELTLGR